MQQIQQYKMIKVAETAFCYPYVKMYSVPQICNRCMII